MMEFMPAVAGALNDALLDIAVLILFAVFFFMAAYIAFIRGDRT